MTNELRVRTEIGEVVEYDKALKQSNASQQQQLRSANHHFLCSLNCPSSVRRP
jgi:hypothetical protein